MSPSKPYLRRTAVFLLIALAADAANASPPITAIAFAPDGSAVVGSQAGVEERSWPDLKPLRRLGAKLAHVHDLRFSPDGALLAIAGGSPGESGEIEVVSWPGGEQLLRLTHHDDLVYGVAWRSDGAALATASWDGTARITNLVDSSSVMLEGHSRGLRAVVFLPGDAEIVTASADQSLRVWNAATGELIRALDNHTAPIHDLAVRPDGVGLPTIASVGADQTLRLWQPTIGRLVRFARLPSEPLSVTWLSGGRIAVACRDGDVRIVDAATAEIIADIPALSGWAYSLTAAPDGESLVVGGAGGELRRIEVPREMATRRRP
ncbi:MAG: hypothetical protein KY475_14945 [Planctomycetes bacterium]|nr:hypothetical protein [Planctomycetota bacterium]